MSETRLAKFQVNSQGRKNDKVNARDLLRLIQNATRYRDPAPGIQLDICSLHHMRPGYFCCDCFYIFLSNRGGSQFGSSDTARKCQTPGGIPFNQLVEPEEQPKIRAHKNC
jgi:hypothetical protein